MRKKVIKLIEEDFEKGKISEEEKNILSDEIKNCERLKNLSKKCKYYYRKKHNKNYYEKNKNRYKQS